MDAFEVRDILGRQVYYRPGTHPATYRMRQHVAMLEKEFTMASPKEQASITITIVAIKSNIAMWEEQHNEAKMTYYERTKERR